MMTETNFQKELRGVAGKYEGRLQKELSDGKGWSESLTVEQRRCDINCAGESLRMTHPCLGPRKYCLFLGAGRWTK